MRRLAAALVAVVSLAASGAYAQVSWSVINGPVNEGSSVYNHIGTDGSALYVVFQNNQFWRYVFPPNSPTGGTWERLADPPRTVIGSYSCSDLAYQDGYLYTSATSGSNRTILRYKITDNTWQIWQNGGADITSCKTTGNAMFMDPVQPGVGYSASATQNKWVKFDWNAKAADNNWMSTAGLGVTDAGWVSRNEDIATDGAGTYYATKNDKTAGQSDGDVVYTWNGLVSPTPTVLVRKPWQSGFAQSIEFAPASMTPSGHDELWLVRASDGSTNPGEGWGYATSDWARLDLANVGAGWELGVLPEPVYYNAEIIRVGEAVFVRGGGPKWFVGQLRHTTPIADAKASTDGTQVETAGVTTAVFASSSQFYIENSQRTCGIQVRYSATLPTVGQELIVTGTLETDSSTHERYIQASLLEPTAVKTVKPVGMTTRFLGGEEMGLQEGVYRGLGINNVGLLVRVAGKLTGVASDASYLYLSDGSGAHDGGTYPGVKIDLSGVPFWERAVYYVGDRVAVTGVSSMYERGGEYHRMIRVRSASDITNLDDDGNRPHTVRVMVINFDPIIESKNNKRLHEVYWPSHAPTTLANYYISDLKQCSFNYANYVIVEWVDVDAYPIKIDGFQYTDESYTYAWEHGGPFHSPDGADYYKIIRDPVYPFNTPRTVADRVAAHEIDEVLMFGAPYFGFWEAAMAGPSPYFINGGTYYVPEAQRNFAIMGFNYERWIGEMLEDFGHRAENHMTRVYGSWNAYPPQHNWDRFTLIDKNIVDHNLYTAGCGNVHYAPNSQSDYEWGSYTYVWSTCDDWLYNWPNLQGTKKRVNCAEWGYGDIRAHHKWWLTHFPHKPGINADGKQNNWWKYLVDFNSYPESR